MQHFSFIIFFFSIRKSSIMAKTPTSLIPATSRPVVTGRYARNKVLQACLIEQEYFHIKSVENHALCQAGQKFWSQAGFFLNEACQNVSKNGQNSIFKNLKKFCLILEGHLNSVQGGKSSSYFLSKKTKTMFLFLFSS